MNDLITNLLLNSVALPLGVALAVGVAGRLAGLGQAGVATALAVLAAEFAGQAAVAGWPALPPNGAVDKLPWLAVGGILLALAAEHGVDSRWRPWVVAAGVGAAVVWIGWPRLAIPDTAAWLAGAVVWGLTVWALGRVRDAGNAGGLVLALLVIVATAGVGLYSSSYSMAQLVGVLAVGLCGAMLAAGTGAAAFGPVARLAVAGPLLGLLTVLALYTNAEPLALLLLAVVPLTTGLAERVSAHIAPDGAVSAHPALRLMVLGVVAMLPAGAAVAVAVARSAPLYY